MTAPTFVDKYQIIKPLGGGNFGDVYHAFDRALQIEKAIKILKTTNPATFLGGLKEAQVLAGCAHRHIVQINEANVFLVNGKPRVVLDLEYVPEGSLESATRSRWISVRDSVVYLRGALLGLVHAHSKGFLHRDIKPANILLATNCPKLSDFGLSTQPGPAAYGSGQGYITHLPPECVTDDITSVQTDVYSAGVTLFRAVCNIADWKAVVSAVPNLHRHIERGTLLRTIGFAPHVPTSLKRIINKACAADPNNRFKSAVEFGQKLDALRFNIDWVRLSDTEWSGSDGNAFFSASLDNKRNEMIIKKNGRRVTSLCTRYSSLAVAIAALEQCVADTSIL